MPFAVVAPAAAGPAVGMLLLLVLLLLSCMMLMGANEIWGPKKVEDGLNGVVQWEFYHRWTQVGKGSGYGRYWGFAANRRCSFFNVLTLRLGVKPPPAAAGAKRPTENSCLYLVSS